MYKFYIKILVGKFDEPQPKFISQKYIMEVLHSEVIFLDSNGFLQVCFVCLMMFNATFNNISVISWWSVLLVEETGVPEENHQPVASH
jgi:hypothetical protein